MKKETFLGRTVKHHSPAKDYPQTEDKVESASKDKEGERERDRPLTREERQELLDQGIIPGQRSYFRSKKPSKQEDKKDPWWKVW